MVRTLLQRDITNITLFADANGMHAPTIDVNGNPCWHVLHVMQQMCAERLCALQWWSFISSLAFRPSLKASGMGQLLPVADLHEGGV